MQPIEGPIVGPATKVMVNCALGRQIFGTCPPLAASAQYVHQTVYNLTDIHRPLVAATLGRPDQGRNQRPFSIRQITRIPQITAFIRNAIFVRPHLTAPANRTRSIESQVTQ